MSAEAATPAAELETRVEQVGALPLTLTERSGRLRLADDRLSFIRRRGRVVFDAPLREFHSFAPAFGGQGFHLWHREARYRFRLPGRRDVYTRYAFSDGVGEVAGSAKDIASAWANFRDAQAGTEVWRKALLERISTRPPAELRIRPPLQGARFWLVLVGTVFAIVSLITIGIVLAVLVIG
jgi:hypothetical protein